MQASLSTRRYFITGSQRISNYLWAALISLGGFGFLIIGFLSFLELEAGMSSASNNLATKTIAFFPQGLVMCFYGSLGILFSIYLWSTIIWKVGDGFNEFDTRYGIIRIFRWGLPGKQRRIDFTYKIKQVESLHVELKEGINPRRTMSLKFKGSGGIPLTRIGQPISLQDIENEASELAKFLQVSLETFYKM